MNKKRQKKIKRPIKILTLDTETRGLFGEMFRVAIYDGADNKYYAANTINEIKNTLIKYSIKYDCHVFIHNLDFDLAKLASELIPNALLDKSIFINNNVTVFSTSLVESQAIEENDIIPQPITLHDSNKIIMGKLSKICKDFGLDEYQSKIDLKDHILSIGWGRDREDQPTSDPDQYDPFNSEGYYFKHVDPWERQLNEYLRMDCVSLYHVITTMIELSELEIDDFLRCPTTASLAMKIFQKNYKADYKKATSTIYAGKFGEAAEMFVREAYCGGRTEVFIPEILDGFHYDENSMYPYAMKTRHIPYGKPIMYSGQKAHDIFSYWYNTDQGAGFIQCDVYVPTDMFIPPLPLKRFNKLIFPTGNITGTWTFHELKMAIDYGCSVHKIHHCLYFEKTAVIFKNFVEYFEEIKNTSKGAKRLFAKLMQNSLYGKFGMKRIRKTLLPYSEKSKCEERLQQENLRYFEFENDLYGKFIEAEVISKQEYIQPHIAAYITSYARMNLFEVLQLQLEKGYVAYCDTDSIVCEKELPPDYIDDLEYGKWKKEAELKSGLFLQPKTYAEHESTGHINLKFKGVPKRQLDEMNYDSFTAILNRLKEIENMEAAGIEIPKEEYYYKLFDGIEKRHKFAATLKSGHTDFDRIMYVKKGMLLNNMQKRKMYYNDNTSAAHELKEW